MNKIISGMLSIAMALTLVAGSAYALVASQVTATGITLGVANAQLSLWTVDGAEELIEADTSRAAGFLGTVKMVPGESYSAPFQLNNDGDVDLKIAGQLTNATGNGQLLDLVQVRFVDTTNSKNSAWYTLEEWKTVRTFNSTIAGGENADYEVQYKLDSSTDLKGESITFNFTITGNQD